MRKTESSDTSSRERTGMYVPCVSLPPSSLKNSLGLLSPWRFKIASLSINTQDGSGAVHEQSSAKAYQRLISANQNSSSWQNINTRRCAIYAREQATPARERRENRHLFLDVCGSLVRFLPSAYAASLPGALQQPGRERNEVVIDAALVAASRSSRTRSSSTRMSTSR